MEDFDFDARLLKPRFVIVTHNRSMETYHWFEEREEAERHAARRDHALGLLVWLRCLTHYYEAFTQTYDFGVDSDEATVAAIVFRLDLIGMSGATSKLALDALIAGYYTQSFMLIRHLIDTWRRVVFIRLAPPSDVWRWFPDNLILDAVKSKPEYKRQSGPPG